MRKTTAYIAISLNGKIAKLDGSVDWLESIPNPEKTDYGYASFYQTISFHKQPDRYFYFKRRYISIVN